MSYQQILEKIPADAEVGIMPKIPAQIYFNLIVEGIAIKELGYQDGVCPRYNPNSQDFLDNLKVEMVIDRLTEKANLELHPKKWIFSDPERAYRSRRETRTRAFGLLSILQER